MFNDLRRKLYIYRRTSRSLARSVKLKLTPRLSTQLIQPDFLQSQALLERILTQNILPFWYPKILDKKDGGYHLNHDLQGKWKGQKNKSLITQARTVWFFSRLSKTKYGTNDYLEAARHGYEFLYNRMWDKEFGGFYWEVDSSGNSITMPDKHLYGQAFALYALSEYAIASGDSCAISLVKKLFSLLEEHAHDPHYGGYREFFQRDWNLPSPKSTTYLGVAPALKLMNTHLHLMEAIATYYRISQEPIARERLIELILLQSNAVVNKRVGACTNQFQQDWTRISGLDGDRISYGHNLENLWLLIEACHTAGICNTPLQDLYRTLFSYALEYGFDWKKGGFYEMGYYNKPADSRKKIWWVQAEALVAALRMYQLTREDVYYHCFCQTLDWIVKHQVDWEQGDWFAEILTNGKAWGNKAGAWKSPYHNGRAMLQCLELLPSLAA